MTEDQIEHVVERAIVKAFRDLGIYAGDNAGEVFEVRADMMFLREWRQTCEQVRSKGMLTIIGMIVTAFGAMLFLGAKQFFH
jgi:hypothetical protein